MKLLCVIQRFGHQIVGGAEFHCWLIAQHLALNHEVEIATTCAVDYLTWENVFPSETIEQDGLKIHRFRIDTVKPDDFDVIAHKTLYGYPSKKEELDYLQAHGPVCPNLVNYLKKRSDIDRFIIFSYRYWISWQALEAVGNRAILVPTAEHDRTLYLKIHGESFHKPLAIAYNSPEEKRLINQISGNSGVPGITVGVGLAESAQCSETELDEMALPPRYFLYIGRIEESKGCIRMMADYQAYYQSAKKPVSLVMIGKKEIPILQHPGIHYLGVCSEDVKNGVLMRSLGLIMPSRYESLSMVLLEAWRVKKPAICNAHCEVLKGQCVRGSGGLFYRNTEEFIESLQLLAERPDIRNRLGISGHKYYEKNYAWSVIMEKYQRLLEIKGRS